MADAQSLDTMMTRNDKDHFDAMEQVLSEARRREHDVPEALTKRVLADALREQPVPVVMRNRVRTWRDWLGDIGGWPTLGGLVAASCVGFWIGISPPEGIGDPSIWLLDRSFTGYDDAAEVSGFGWDLQEG